MSDTSAATLIESATVGAHGAHSPLPHVGYPHAGQIANALPSAGILIATAVPFARWKVYNPGRRNQT